MAYPPRPDPTQGLAAGGRGGPEDQLLEDGQEEVFAREELVSGEVEHHVGEAGKAAMPKPRRRDRP